MGILADHMTQIGVRACLLDPNADISRLIDRAKSQWNKQATFEWRWQDAFTGGYSGTLMAEPCCNSGFMEMGPPESAKLPEIASDPFGETIDDHNSFQLPLSEFKCFECAGFLSSSGECIQCFPVQDCFDTIDVSYTDGADWQHAPSVARSYSPSRNQRDISSLPEANIPISPPIRLNCMYCGAASVQPGETFSSCLAGNRVQRNLLV